MIKMEKLTVPVAPVNRSSSQSSSDHVIFVITTSRHYYTIFVLLSPHRLGGWVEYSAVFHTTSSEELRGPAGVKEGRLGAPLQWTSWGRLGPWGGEDFLSKQ